MLHENKQLICDKFCETLRLTRNYHDLLRLEYVEEDVNHSHVVAWFPGGTLDINTSLDSGWAMIQDIVKRLPLA